MKNESSPPAKTGSERSDGRKEVNLPPLQDADIAGPQRPPELQIPPARKGQEVLSFAHLLIAYT
ncbi:hypothetical protein HYV30_03440 [Candidatus Kaiserbacteria bacterium]|nr:hypothetical protein [Candidatus Kaiserbacteria bacterium]